MTLPAKLRATIALLLLIAPVAHAQVISWPTPEVEALYKSAQTSLSSGAFRQAIASYQQAIALAPDQMILYRDLANAYLLSGSYFKAEETITPIIDKGQADAQSYAIAASIQSALRKDKKARKLLDRGISRFPNSGYLYHERGKIYEGKGDGVEALKAWTGGIAAEPNYHVNYYEAARLYMETEKPIWAIIYGEMFVNLERFTPRSGESRKMLLAAYRRFFATPDVAKVLKYGRTKATAAPKSFESAVTATLLKLSPVMTDGISTENLIMLRTRFSIEWQATYANKYPFTLFQMYDDMLRAGHFDAYNQWLFGRAENPAQYDAWNKFHPEAIPAYQAWQALHPLQPTVSDAYNNDISKDIFIGSK